MATSAEVLTAASTLPDVTSFELDLPARHRPVVYKKTMLEAFLGVPKPALQAVFGERLGKRIWQQLRLRRALIADSEVLHGMIEFVSRQAAETLQDHGRKARAVTLEVAYTDEISSVCRMRLPRPTNSSIELLAAGLHLFHRSQVRTETIVSIDLRVASIEAETGNKDFRGWGYSMTNANNMPVV